MKFPKKRIATIATFIAVGGMGAAFAYHNISHGEHRTPTKFESTLAPNGTELVVRTFRIPSSHTAASEIAFTGTLQPRYQSPIGFRVSGKIATRHVEVGNFVKKGDLLFQLDPTDYDLNLRVAEAELVSARSTLTQASAEEKRLQQLRSTGSVSLSDYDLSVAARDVSQARLDSAIKRLELAKNQRGYCELQADSDGLITAISGEAGQVVNIGQTVLQLMQGNELEAVVSIPENRVAYVRELEPTISIWSRPDVRIPAELRELSPIADPLSRTYDAKFRLKIPAVENAIGMTATVHLSDKTKDGISLPTTAIANHHDATVVWKVNAEDGTVQAIPIEVLAIKNENTLVRGSLQTDDLIVSAGVQRVDEGVKVRVWNSK